MAARSTSDTRKQTNTKLLPETRAALEERAEGLGLPLGTYIARVLEAHVEGEPAPTGQGGADSDVWQTLDQVVDLFRESRADSRMLREDLEQLRGEFHNQVRLLLVTIQDPSADPELVVRTWKEIMTRGSDTGEPGASTS